MKPMKAYQTILKRHKHAYFIVDYDTNEVLYSNHEMNKLLIDQKKVLGEPFYHLISGDESGKGTMPALKWNEETVLHEKIYDVNLRKTFNVTYVRVREANRKLLLIEYVRLEAEEEKRIYFEVAQRISAAQMDEECKINMLLQLLAEVYKSDCAYLHLIDHESKTIKLKSSWVKETITDTTHYLVKDVEDIAGFEGLILWANCRDEYGIWDCDMDRKNSPQQAMDNIALALFRRRNLVLCGYNDEQGRLLGVVSIGDCQNLEMNHRLLHAVKTLIQGMKIEK